MVDYAGRLKMREWKMRYGTDRIARAENAGVKNAGVDRKGGKCRRKLHGTPN